jgi:hypothetical protein
VICKKSKLSSSFLIFFSLTTLNHFVCLSGLKKKKKASLCCILLSSFCSFSLIVMMFLLKFFLYEILVYTKVIFCRNLIQHCFFFKLHNLKNCRLFVLLAFVHFIKQIKSQKVCLYFSNFVFN